LAPKPNTIYTVVVLKQKSVHFHPLKLTRGAKRISVNIKLTPKQAQPLPKPSARFAGLSIVVEKVNDRQLLVTHFVAFSTNPEQKTFLLPIPRKLENLKLGQKLKSLPVQRVPQGLQLQTSTLRAQMHRFAYSYHTSFRQGQGRLTFEAPIAPEQFALFLSPHFALLNHPIQAKSVRLGPQKRLLSLYRFPQNPKQPQHRFDLALKDKLYQPPSLLNWLKSWKQDPNKRNKLLGLALMIVISLLGLFLTLSSKPTMHSTQPTPTPPTPHTEPQETKDDPNPKETQSTASNT
ncbi:MAG: hypothetical protein AAGJ35_15670, partial [Myxococcota bacterium]